MNNQSTSLLFTGIVVAFVTVLLISNIVSTKVTDLGWFVFDAGTLLFPLSYIFGDIITEVYGFKRARFVIWLGFGAALLMSLVIMLVGVLPPAADWPFQEAYQSILGLTPRIVLASLIAYLAGEFSNSKLLIKIREYTKGEYMWMRFLGSTVIGQGFDTVIFVLVAFLGVFPTEVLVAIILSNYMFKLGIEVVLMPVTYRIVNYIKTREGLV